MSGCSLLPSAAANLLHNGAWRASSPSSAHPLLTTAACSCNARPATAISEVVLALPALFAHPCALVLMWMQVCPRPPLTAAHRLVLAVVTRLPPTRRALLTVGLVYRPPPPSRWSPFSGGLVSVYVRSPQSVSYWLALDELCRYVSSKSITPIKTYL